MKKVLFVILGLAAFAIAATTGINSAPAGQKATSGDLPSDLQAYDLSDNYFVAATDSILTAECKYYGPYRLSDVGGPVYDKVGFMCPLGTVEAGDSLQLSMQTTGGNLGTLADTMSLGWTTITDTSFSGGYRKTGVSVVPGKQIWFRLLASEGAGNVRIYKTIRVFLEKSVGYNRNLTN